MPEKNEDPPKSDAPDMQAPTEAEFQVLSAIWQHPQAVGLNQICQTVNQRLSKVGMPLPATTTISTYVRRLIDKGLVRARSVGPAPSLKVGMLTPRIKPRVAMYEPTCQPSDLMSGTFDNLVQAYPPEVRSTKPLLDLIQVMDLSAEKAAALRLIVEHDGDNAELLHKLIDAFPLDESRRRALRAALAGAHAKPHRPSSRGTRR